jgi:hypothetical protein
MCCGMKRATLTRPMARRAAPTSPPPTFSGREGPASDRPAGAADWGASPWVMLRYAQSPAVRVVGPVTGRPYHFSGERPTQMVDARDAAVLARGNVFRPA